MKTTDISVIVTTRNRKYEVKRALDSVRAQTKKPLEVILVDDGSTDGTRAYIESQAYENLRYICHPADGQHSVGHSRNTGIREARGEYVAFLDSDAIWYPRKLEIFAGELEQSREQVDVIYSRYKRHIRFGWRELPIKPDFACESREEILLHSLANASASLYRKKFLEEIGLFNEEMATNTDWELLLRGMYQRGCSLVSVEEVLSENWTMYDGMTRQREVELRERLQLFSRYLDELDRADQIRNYYRLYIEEEREEIPQEKLDAELIRACGDSPERIAKLLEYQKQEIEKWRAQTNRKGSFYQLMCNWMRLKLSGGSVAGRLAEAGYQSVAIYGAGNHGRMLYEDLKGTQIPVKYFIDKQKKGESGEVPVYLPGEDLPAVDAIIVTPYLEFASVQAALQDKTHSRLIPLNTLVQPGI